MVKNILKFLCAFFLVSACKIAGADTIYVVPDGVTAGSNVAGVVTIDELRLLVKNNISNLIIKFASGRYRLDSPLVFGRGSHDIRIEGPNDQSAILDGSISITQIPGDVPGNTNFPLIAEMRQHVKTIQLSLSGISEILQYDKPRRSDARTMASFQVFIDEQPGIRARIPSSGYAFFKDNLVDISALSKSGVNVDLIERSLNNGGTINGFPQEDWQYEIAPVHANASGGLSIDMSGNHEYKNGSRFFFENMMAGIVAPNNWVVDKKAGQLIYWPKTIGRPNTVDISKSISLIHFESAKNISTSNLVFERSAGPAIVVDGSSDSIIFDNILVRDSGGVGIFVEASRFRLSNSIITGTAGTGVLLYSGNRQTLVAGDSIIENNLIENFGKRFKTYQPAVALEGVGNVVQGNEIRGGPHAAIIFGGNNHSIIKNNIYEVVSETNDAAAIYSGRDWTARGTRIIDNFIHDIKSTVVEGNQLVAAVYLDDQASGISVCGNFIYNVASGIMVGGGRDNQIVGNLVFGSEIGLHFDNRGQTWQKGMVTDPRGGLLYWLSVIPYKSPAYVKAYPSLENILSDEPGVPKYNKVAKNTVVANKQVRVIGDWPVQAGFEMPLTENDMHYSDVPPAKGRSLGDMRINAGPPEAERWLKLFEAGHGVLNNGRGRFEDISRTMPAVFFRTPRC